VITMGDNDRSEDSDTQNQEETTETTVYSDTDDDLPDPIPISERERGDTWRTALVKRCPVCHCLTNKWIIGGYRSAGPRCPCPATRREGETMYDQISDKEQHRKHEKLEELIERRDELQQRIEQYDSDSDAAERTRNRLSDELETINRQIAQYRNWFSDRFDDVVGVDPNNREITTAELPDR